MSLLQAPVRHRLLIRIMAIFTLSNSYPSFFLSELRLDTLIISKRGYANTTTAAPTARYLKSWECKRSWEQAVADSITCKDCKLVMNEVYEGNLELLVQRADELFRLMPNNNTTVELSEHSPLRAKKTTPTVNPANPSR